MNCDGAKICAPQSYCNSKPKFKMNEIDKFFEKNISKCKTSLVYLNVKLELIEVDELLVKTIRQKNGKICNICYRYKNGYYYIYRDLIANIIMIINGKIDKVILGNHLTIGFKTDFDIHDTVYRIQTDKQTNISIISKLINRVEYQVNNNNELIKIGEYYKDDSNYESYNKNFWNDIRCFYTKKSGGGPKLKLTKPTKKIKINKPIKKVKHNKELEKLPKTSKEFAEIIIERLKQVYKLKEKYVIVKIPKIPITLRKRVAKLIHPHIKQNYETLMVFHNKACFISLNIL